MPLSERFDPAEAEPRLYAGWEAAGAFAASARPDAEPFTIMIPPPNVTGSLHVGHALTMTMQDVLVRFRRMQGRDALWMPGTDHAGIATQMMVERELAREQTTRQAIGREAFTDRVWRWKAESGGAITTQLRRLGASLDWPRERFTMDEGLSAAVRATFVRLHRDGLIYRDRRLVNWDPKLGTAISDLEVESRETRGHLWHIAYPLAGDGQVSGSITVATTRPETLLGDTAVAVHPEDSRYTHLIGRMVVVPITGRRIPIVADTYSDPGKGTGAVKITPAHDFNDFEVGRRHDLAMPSVIDRQGRVMLAEITERSDFLTSLDGMDRDAARGAIVTELERLGALVAVEPHTSTVPHGDRSGMVIEPLLTVQWYCDAARLAGPAVAAVEQGRTTFVPRQWENTFFAWMREIEPWCISRQLWWGHRIPAWYGPDGTVFVEADDASAVAAARAHYGRDEKLERDLDVLDTWFSSALWPFSTLGWPEPTVDLARYYPGDVLVTGFDIIFFWVARMMMMGLHLMGDVPFRTVAIHGLVRDERGQKMSKSKGNVVDPLALIEQYGADALRFTVAAACGPGRDVKLGAQKVEISRGFVTKLWNAARFGEMNGFVAAPGPVAATLPLTRWVLAEAGDAVAACTVALDAFRLDDYAAAAYRFLWSTYCDWFLELAKYGLQGPDAAELRAVGGHVLGVVLRLLHPIMPFVTEALWDDLGYGPMGSLIRTAWPEPIAVAGTDAARAEIDWLVRLIGTVRTVRSEMGVAPSKLAPVLLRDATDADLARGRAWRDAIARMARAADFGPLVGEVPRGAAQAVLDHATIVIPLAGLIDLDAERARLAKDRARAAKDVEAADRKLGNPDFVARAKPEVVDEIRERLDAARAEVDRIEAALARVAA